jgi:hypothetical protein
MNGGNVFKGKSVLWGAARLSPTGRGGSLFERVHKRSLDAPFDATLKHSIALDESASLACETRSRLFAAAGSALQYLEPRGPFQLSNISPGGAVRHAHSFNGLVDGAQLVD